MNISEVVKSLSGFLTPIIAVTTVSIIVLQYKLAKQRWRLDLFDKRFEVYWHTKNFISYVDANARVHSDQVQEFHTKSRDCDFLFSEDVQDYLDELFKQGIKLQSNTTRMDEMDRSTQDWQRECDTNEEILEWFAKQHDIAKEKFGGYLRLEKR